MNDRNVEPGDPTTAPLTRRTATAAQWQFSSAIVHATLQFGVGVLLARLLPPEDFGLVALAFVFTGLAGLFSTLGLRPTLVQRRELTPRHVRVGFTVSALLGAGVAAALLLLAPLSTFVFPNEDLPAVLRLISLLFIIRGLGTVSGALLQRDLDFRKIFFIGTTSYVLGYAVVAVTLALLGFGVWSLVAGSLSQALVETVLIVAVVRHPMTPLLASRELKDLLKYGVGFSANNLLVYAADNGDRFVIGRWLGDAPLGLYTRAFALMNLPQLYFTTTVRSVLLPALSKVQDDQGALARAYVATMAMTTLFAAPVLIGMIVAAPHMIVGLYGPNWTGSIVPLQILAAFGLFRATYPLGSVVGNATGRVYWVAGITLVYVSLVVAGGILATPWGIEGVALAVGLAVAVMFFGVSHLSLRITGLRWRSLLSAQAPGLLVAMLVGASALVVRLLLEGLHVQSLLIFLAILASCAVTLALGLHWLPSRMRPEALYDHLTQIADTWPAVLRRTVRWALRL